MIDFARLIDGFARLHAQAIDLQTPNVEDHNRIKMAMVGFSLSADIERWEYQQFQFVQTRLDTDLSTDDFSASWIEFACLAMGYLLGLSVSGNITSDADFAIAEAQLPGFMWMHSVEIERLKLETDGA